MITVIHGEARVRQVRVLALRSMLKLECKGMKRHGRSAYAIVKEEFGYRGSKVKVLAQLSDYIHHNILPETPHGDSDS